MADKDAPVRTSSTTAMKASSSSSLGPGEPEPAAKPASGPNGPVMAKLKGRLARFRHDLQTYRRAYAMAAITSMGGTLFGWDTGLIGGVLTMPQFQHSFKLDKESRAFANLSGNIVSVLQAGCFFGAAFSFWTSDGIGRKRSILLADAVFLIGSLVQTLCALDGPTDSLAMLLAGRFIGGWGVGMMSALVPTFISEKAHRAVRGRCVGTMQLFNVSGIALSYFVNYAMNRDFHDQPTNAAAWRIPFALQMLPGVALMVGMPFLQESPRWLVDKGRLDEARHALASVRSGRVDDDKVAAELAEIVAEREARERSGATSWSRQARAVLATPSSRYPALLAVALFTWQQWTGTNSINYYSPQIFQSVGLAGTDAGLFATGIYGVVKVVFTGVALAVGIEWIGRKWLLVVGGLGQGLTMFYIGGNMGMHPADKTLSAGNLAAIVCIYLYVVFFSLAWGAVPFVISSECSPNETRALIMSAALVTHWLWNFTLAKLTPVMLANIGYGTFLLFGTLATGAAVFAVFFVPETKGVPLESVGLLFEGNGLGDVVKGATRDVVPRLSRARKLRHDGLTADASAGRSV